MSVITFDFSESRRSREEYLIALAAAVQETITADPVFFGALTPADLLDCEAECQCQEGGARHSTYRFAVGAVHAKPGEAINPDLCLDPARHYCAVEWARRYLAEVNTAFDLKLEEVGR